MSLKPHVIAAVLAVGGLSLAVPATAQATPWPAGTSGAITSTTPVDSTIDPELQAYLDTLTPQEQENFVATMLPSAVVEATGPQQPVDANARTSLRAAAAAGRAVSPQASGCWTARTNGSTKAAAGNTLYTYYHVGRWCSSGTKVTSASVADAGGETRTPGWSYKGVINRSSGIVANQARSYSQVKFTLGVGGWTVQSPTPCLRINGTSSGTASSQATCGIY